MIADPGRLAALRTSGLLETQPSESFDRLTRMVVRVTGAPAALVSLVDADRRILLSSSGLNAPWDERRETPLADSFCRDVVERGSPLVLEDTRNVTPLGGGDLGAAAYAGFPLSTPEGHTIGVLAAIDASPRQWSQGDLEALDDLAASVMSEISLRHLAQRLSTEARTDPVTGLGNRRHWDLDGPRELARARAFGHSLVLALLDLDRFRRFNDRHGNSAGDQLLRDITQSWRASLRDVDLLMRFSGVQFAVAMPATGLDPAFDIVERLRGDLPSGLVCSAGLAMLRDGEDADALLQRADSALVRAKRSGRNASALAS